MAVLIAPLFVVMPIGPRNFFLIYVLEVILLLKLIEYLFKNKSNKWLDISVNSLVVIILVAFSSIQMARYKRDFDFRTLFFVSFVSFTILMLISCISYLTFQTINLIVKLCWKF